MSSAPFARAGRRPLPHQFRLVIWPPQVLHQAQKADATGRSALKSAVKRRKTNVYNAFLRNASDRGSFSLVQEAVRCMRRDGVRENEWTSAIRLNAFARQGRLAEAQAVLREAGERGFAPNNAMVAPLVQCLMEPRFSHGGDSSRPTERVREALRLVHSQLAGSEPPSERTINHLLRGCKRWAPHISSEVLREGMRWSQQQLPLSTLALAAEIACVSHDAARACSLVHAMRERGVSVDAVLLTDIATVHALSGDLPAAAAALADAALADSVLADGAQGGGARGGGRQANLDRSHAAEADGAPRLLPRRGTPASVLHARQRLVASFVAEGGAERRPGSRVALAHSELVSWPGSRREQALSSAAHLRSLVQGQRRVCVEIGAGSGEWLVAQAAADASTSWVAVEPQLDRVHRMWSQVQLQSLTNVHICATDAHTVLRTMLPPAAADDIYLRFPFPPSVELSDLLADAPPEHALVGSGFVTDAEHALRVGGTLHAVTNEPTCCALLLALLARRSDLQLRSSAHGDAGFARLCPEQVAEQRARSEAGQPSFFDTVLGEGRGSPERYFLAYTRE